MRGPRIIGPYKFPTKKSAEEAIKEVLHGSPLNTPLTGEAFGLIRALLDNHHDAAAKIGAGVSQIEVRIIEFGARGFWIVRVDGSAVDFSYRVALNGAPSSRANVTAALRWEIQDQIDRFRDEAFSKGAVVCPLTNQPLHRGNAHVDHVTDFAEMADKLVEAVGGWDALEVECVGETGARRQLKDRQIAQVWQLYHERMATLRLVHKSANLARRRGSE